ncbi:DUF3306 domain-containing protein [Methylobacterium currus]|uniref:DUF3306 domain-containing protein n=1 Tax=Methylobacterium currus TaxID=2051553 RepID=UPI001E4C97DF|nr:DUF3306 domain-containing protein [Methylobacterium currus]UHC15976.1 DUF3306 domain-containing protein [Methylobacterium currus]
MSDGFLARWSRRKRDEARRPAEIPPVAPAEPAAEPAEDDGSLSPEELAQLPSLDALTAATDLAPFLRAGVPRALRNAALRRMWSVDPAIRDFVSEAREYAYDWNTPGGVPGTGGLIPAEEVRAMVERVFGGGEEKRASASGEGDAAGDVAHLSSPRGRCAPLVGGAASGEPQVRREAEGVSPSEAPPEPPPHPRSSGSLFSLNGATALSPPSERGENQGLIISPESPALAGTGDAHDHGEPVTEPGTSLSPPRLRRHGGALPI